MYLKFAINQSVLFIFTEIQMQTEIPMYLIVVIGKNISILSKKKLGLE